LPAEESTLDFRRVPAGHDQPRRRVDGPLDHQRQGTTAVVRPISNRSHGAGFAVGNVTFYFTTLAASVQEEVLTSCLTATYAGQPRWPTRLNLNTRPYSNHGGTPEP